MPTDQTPPFVGILSNGTSGDVNNIDFRCKNPRRYRSRTRRCKRWPSKVAGRCTKRIGN